MKVSVYQIDYINSFLELYGKDALYDAIWHGAFSFVGLQYIHPDEELEKTKNFKLIQEAFIRAIV